MIVTCWGQGGEVLWKTKNHDDKHEHIGKLSRLRREKDTWKFSRVRGGLRIENVQKDFHTETSVAVYTNLDAVPAKRRRTDRIRRQNFSTTTLLIRQLLRRQRRQQRRRRRERTDELQGTTVCAAFPKQTKRSPGRPHQRPSPRRRWCGSGAMAGGTTTNVTGKGVHAPDYDLTDRLLTDGRRYWHERTEGIYKRLGRPHASFL